MSNPVLNDDASLNEAEADPNPFKQFEIWFQEAQRVVPILPNAMTLATSTKEGVPSSRVVLLKGFDERGFVFYTNYESQKGRELEANPICALSFYWSQLARQIRITGRVTRTTRAESLPGRPFPAGPVHSYRLPRPAGRSTRPIQAPDAD